MIRNQLCDCGQNAPRQHLGQGVCEFCYWCETSGISGGRNESRSGYARGRISKPMVWRGAAWIDMVAWLHEVHGNHDFWDQRDSAAERFNALFRKPKAVRGAVN